MKATRPENGCARCVWWVQKWKSDNGRCAVHQETRYYRCPPCSEYERDNEVPDTIGVPDEIHNDN